MEYHKIVSVTGLTGLFELLSSKSDGAVVKSLEDNSTKFVSTRMHNFSHLESIEVFTSKDNTKLADVFNAMIKSKEKRPDAKADAKTLKAYFEKVYPDLDFDRVYTSDMKKMVKWLDVLEKNKVDLSAKATDETGETPGDAPAAKPVVHKETPHVKDLKPQKAAPRKIESRGVK